ncbi:hypothetical protein F4804DRAFT_331196 [Jackrogersella minutella]|nr:hypothetical protein F4804DRAFT_331196 [Jackrogersella minutella]
MLRNTKLAIWLFVSMLATTLALPGIPDTLHQLSDRDTESTADMNEIFIGDAPIVDESEE